MCFCLISIESGWHRFTVSYSLKQHYHIWVHNDCWCLVALASKTAKSAHTRPVRSNQNTVNIQIELIVPRRASLCFMEYARCTVRLWCMFRMRIINLIYANMLVSFMRRRIVKEIWVEKFHIFDQTPNPKQLYIRCEISVAVIIAWNW